MEGSYAILGEERVLSQTPPSPNACIITYINIVAYIIACNNILLVSSLAPT
jgi:hypothetical protein